MIELVIGSGLVGSVVAGLLGYGRMWEKVHAIEGNFDLLRKDISRLDDRIVDLTDFLLREFHGEDPDQIRRPTTNRDPDRGGG